jgi:uncharacterized protein
VKQLPSRLRRLDDALADLPLDEPMLLTELDGFLHGVVACPESIMPDEWLRNVWGSDENGVAPFEDPADVQWFVDAVMARYNEIVRDLGRGKPRPIFDIDERNGDVLWEYWIDSFGEVMELRPESWDTLINGDDNDAADAASALTTLIAVARNESSLDSLQINALQDHAPSIIKENVLRLYRAGPRIDAQPQAMQGGEQTLKIGRNEPCHCGSGRKFKYCCGGL